MDLLTLHYRETRHADLKAADGIFFNQELKCWIVVDPELVIELLRDDERLGVPDVVAPIQMLEGRYRRQFPNLLFAVRGIPLLIEGQAHREIRRGLAEIILAGRPRIIAALPELLARYVEPLDRAASPEWLETSLSPLVGEVFRLMCDCPAPLPFPKLVLTRLFDRFVSLTALGEAEKGLGELRQCLAETAPDVDPAQVIALLVLGRDSLLGTLATSLDSILRQNIGKQFADIEFPDFPPDTGVAIAERVAAADIPIGARTIAAGDRIRLYFQPISDAGGGVNRQALFGAGVHSCLGRPISLDVWRAMIESFSRFSSRLKSVACEYEPNNIFVVPRYLRTEHVR